MAVSFHEVRFPKDISYGVTGGPEYNTDITVTKSELEQRNLLRLEGRCKYNAAYGVKSREQYSRLLTFFRARKGKTFGFRFKDWFDYKATNQIIGTGDGTKTKFQLIKRYADDAGEDIRKINKPVKETLIIYVGGQLLKNWICDYTTGEITFSAPPELGAVITADFQFDVPVRFDIAQMVASYDDFSSISWSGIPLVELIDE